MQNERKVVELSINDVLPNRFQPRIKFDEDSINELALSIKKYGVIQPIVVRKIGNKYEIIAGERRYKASVIAGKNTIPAIVSDLTDKDSVEIALIENVQREDLTPIEKAISYKKILDMGYINQEELAIKVGKSQSAIANTLRLLNLCDEAQEALLENKISERHARSLLKIKDESKQILMLNRIINERLTVRKTDEEIEKMFNENNNSFSNSTQFNGIPTTTQNDEIVSIPDNNIVNPINNNLPGFMNIDRIENEAKDINIPNTKPEINMDQLLNPTGTVAPVNPEPEELHSNKFFNFFDEPSDTESNSTSTERTIPIFNVPTFDAPTMLSTPQTMDIPNVPTVDIPTFDTPTMPSAPQTMDIPNIPAVDIPTFDAPTMPNAPQTMDIPNIPAVDIPTFDAPTMPSAPQTMDIPNIPAVDIPTFDAPTMPSEPQTMDIPSVPTVDIPTFDAPTMPSTPQTMDIPSVPTVDIPTFEVPTMPSAPQTMDIPNIPAVDIPTFEVPTMPSAPQTMDMPNTSVSMNEPIIPSIEVGPIPNPYVNMNNNETIEVPEMSSTSTNMNIKYALEEVRNLEKKLENMGYTLQVDELDLTDTYQILFKIQK